MLYAQKERNECKQQLTFLYARVQRRRHTQKTLSVNAEGGVVPALSLRQWLMS